MLASERAHTHGLCVCMHPWHAPLACLSLCHACPSCASCGRWGGRAGKLARIKAQEEEAAARARQALGE